MKNAAVRWRWLPVCAVWLALIFSQSAMPASLSGAESQGLLAQLVAIFPMLTEHLLRKVAHFGEFMILGLLLALWLRGGVSWPAFGGLVCALGDETIQLYVEGRSGQVSDVWIDFFGVLAGVALVLALRWQKRQRVTRKR